MQNTYSKHCSLAAEYWSLTLIPSLTHAPYMNIATCFNSKQNLFM